MSPFSTDGVDVMLERVVSICSRGTIEHVADRQGQASVLTGISTDQDVDSLVRKNGRGAPGHGWLP
jgi:hypothetical protein